MTTTIKYSPLTRAENRKQYQENIISWGYKDGLLGRDSWKFHAGSQDEINAIYLIAYKRGKMVTLLKGYTSCEKQDE